MARYNNFLARSHNWWQSLARISCGSSPRENPFIAAGNDIFSHGHQESWEPGSAPELVARKNHDDGLWYVNVTWGNGRKNRQGPYKTEAIAAERIKTLLDAWHESETYFGDEPCVAIRILMVTAAY